MKEEWIGGWEEKRAEEKGKQSKEGREGKLWARYKTNK